MEETSTENARRSERPRRDRRLRGSGSEAHDRGRALRRSLAVLRAAGDQELDDARYRVREGSPLRNFFGRMRACDVTTATVDRYINLRRAEGRKNATINREIELLRRAFRVARKAKKLVRVPEMPEKLPEKNARQGFFEKAELDRLLPYLPAPLDDMTRFAFKSGWRRGELRTLTWESVVGNEIRLGTTKNGQPRS